MTLTRVWGQNIAKAFEQACAGGISSSNSCSLVLGQKIRTFDLTFIPQIASDCDLCVLQVLQEHREPEDSVIDSMSLLRRYQAIIDLAPPLISVKDRQGYIRLANHMFSELDGPPPADYLDRNVFELFPPEIAKALWENDLAVFESGQIVEVEEKVKHRDGSMHTYLTHKFPLKEESGQVIEVCAISIDITARKFFEEQAIAERQKAEAASQVKSDFLANMSHEIRTPLTVIRGYAELIAKKNSELKGPVASWVSSIIRSSKQLEMIINDILNLAKVESGKIEIEKSWIDMPQFMQELKSNFSLKAQEKDIFLNFHIRGHVPTQVETDALRLKQILTNLINNAIKFTELGGVDVTLVMLESKRLAFDIKDSGIGIRPEQQAKIFQPFAQADNSITRKYGGTGLGLILSKRLATLLGGDVTLEQSAPNRGSVFRASFDPGLVTEQEWVDLFLDITLPLSEDFDELPNEQTLTGQSILLVEDDNEIQKLVEYVLHQHGAKVQIANHGGEALNLWHQSAYDLILLDMQMPVVDGIQATLMLRALGCEVPIIALTAHATVGEREKCLLAGCDDYLTKPFKTSKLIEIVKGFQKK